MFDFFSENELILNNQPGFKPGDSCINQLLSINHNIYQSLDISRAFDKVWHKGPLFKLKQNSILGNLLNITTAFLYQRKQRVALNGQHSSWSNIEAEVSQGSILGTLFFLISINNLSDGLTSNAELFTDDTSLFPAFHNINSTGNDLNSNLMKISNWAFQ